jgi:hypothetical protein
MLTRGLTQTITLDTPREVSAIHLVAAGEDPGGEHATDVGGHG